MNQFNKPPKQNCNESPVSPRFSFADSDAARQDNIYSDGYRTRRVVSYPSPREDGLVQVRDALAGQGLIWGARLDTSNNPAVTSYQLPNGLRPLSYDVSSRSTSEFVYGDNELFFDIGKLLGRLAHAGPELPYVLSGNVGANIGIKEFSRVDEPKILFVPGFENVIAPVENDDEALNIYGGMLLEEFNRQFENNAELFTEGFRVGLG